MSCDDDCKFKMSHGLDPLDPSQATTKNYMASWTYYRNTDVQNKSESSGDFGKRFSAWVDLVEDEFYYVEATLN